MACPGTPRVTVSASAQSLTTLLGLTGTPPQRYYSQLTLKSESTNVGTMFFGNSTVTTSTYCYSLTPGSSFGYGALVTYRVHSSEIFVVGTPGDILQIVEVT